MNSKHPSPFSIPNVRRFIIFKVCFNSRFYYPVFAIMFLDYGLTLTQFAMLNVIWAATIVLLEVPSGALADTFGRRNLLILAATLMVIELAIIAFVPLGNVNLVFSAFLINRILSGMAEAAASGADEALAYDTLAREGNADDWGKVLDWQMRAQAIGYMVAMSLGAAMYDTELMQSFANVMGLSVTLTQDITIRIPIVGTLCLSFITLLTTLRMQELQTTIPCNEQEAEKEDCVETSSATPTFMDAFRVTLATGGWIARTPLPLAVILFGLLFDHTTRMQLTLNSQYYRSIMLPEASFGLIASAMSVIGILAPRLGLWLAENKTPAFNAGFLGVSCLCGFILVSQAYPYWGVLPMALLIGVMYNQNFLVSHYLNKLTDSSRRATALSFKGLSNNLAYGLIGILYSMLLAFLKGRITPQDITAALGDIETATFIASLKWFPWYFAALFCLIWVYSASRLKSQQR